MAVIEYCIGFLAYCSYENSLIVSCKTWNSFFNTIFSNGSWWNAFTSLLTVTTFLVRPVGWCSTAEGTQVRICHCFICVIRWLDLLKEIVWIETYMNKICILTASVSYWSQIIKFLPVQVREICVDFKNPSSVGSNKFLSRYTLKLMLISTMVYRLWRSVIVCLIKPELMRVLRNIVMINVHFSSSNFVIVCHKSYQLTKWSYLRNIKYFYL